MGTPQTEFDNATEIERQGGRKETPLASFAARRPVDLKHYINAPRFAMCLQSHTILGKPCPVRLNELAQMPEAGAEPMC